MKHLIFISAIVMLTGFKDAGTREIFTAKNKMPRGDYRDAYVGNYFCYRSTTNFMANDIGFITRDTLTISVAKASPDSILQVNTLGRIYQFKLKDTILYAYPYGGRQIGKVFTTDSMWLSIPVGHACSYYTGKKR